MSNLKSCSRCGGFVPAGRSSCPHCMSSSAWWRAPLAFAGAGLATVTLSACYGAPCVTQVKLPDGTQHNTYGDGIACGTTLDCNARLEDGGVTKDDATWRSVCQPTTDGGMSDGGVSDGGVSDAGTIDAGP
jgi:hypothetical protein